jgi:hypothetical protein
MDKEVILKKHTELNKIQLTNPHYTSGGVKNGIKTSGTFVLFEDVPYAMQEYSDQQNKALLKKIESRDKEIKELNSIIEGLYEDKAGADI